MKNKVWIPVIAVLLLLAILFAPILQGTAEDGGTRVYRSLTYKLVKWNRIMPNDIYRSTRFYFGKDMKKSLDELWEMEKEAYLLTSDEWLDRSKEPAESPLTLFLTVTEVHSDHIIARTSLDSEQYLIKINGTSEADFCVGDSVYLSGENCFIDRKNHRIEADYLSAFTDISVAEKPVIYLYPEEETDVTVSLTFNGKLTCTYPAYKDGWRVTAAPDGTLTDKEGKQYNYLYWEGIADTEYDMSHGFCVSGEDTATFLEDALASLGLNRREANEFIVYWLPKMQDNEYNIISFQSEVYESNARLDITPAPDTIIRVFMAWQSFDTYVAIQPQELTAPARTGFTVIEWGGTDIS